MLTIDKEKCTACGVCEGSCAFGAIAVEGDCAVANDQCRLCGACEENCPVGAIMMVRLNPDDPNSLRIPAVDETKCIGCGACENLCPSRPYSAIHVNGLQVHIKE